MGQLNRYPQQLVQVDTFVIFDDFLQASRPRLQATFIVPAKAAGVSLATTAFFTVDRAIRIDSVQILPDGSSAGIDAGDTSVWLVKAGAATVATKTYNNVTVFPLTHVQDTLGTLTNQDVAAGSYLTIAVTNTTTAATPATILSVGYTDQAAVGQGWTILDAQGGGAALSDGLGGILTLTPSGGTPAASDEIYLYSSAQVFQPASGQPLSVDCYVQYTEANTNQAGIFVGIASGVSAGALLTALAAGVRTTGTVVGFYKLAGQTTWSCIAQNGASNVTTAVSSITAGTVAYQRLTIDLWDNGGLGTGSVTFRVDGQIVRLAASPFFAFVAPLVLAADALGSLVVGVKNGSSTMETLNVDWLCAYQNRFLGADL